MRGRRRRGRLARRVHPPGATRDRRASAAAGFPSLPASRRSRPLGAPGVRSCPRLGLQTRCPSGMRVADGTPWRGGMRHHARPRRSLIQKLTELSG